MGQLARQNNIMKSDKQRSQICPIGANWHTLGTNLKLLSWSLLTHWGIKNNIFLCIFENLKPFFIIFAVSTRQWKVPKEKVRDRDCRTPRAFLLCPRDIHVWCDIRLYCRVPANQQQDLKAQRQDGGHETSAERLRPQGKTVCVGHSSFRWYRWNIFLFYVQSER